MPSEATSEKDSAAGPLAPWRVKAVSVLSGYRLAVTFQDGLSGVVDLSAVSSSTAPGIYSSLADPAIFGQAFVELGVVTWPGGADLDPAWMHECVKDAGTWVVPL